MKFMITLLVCITLQASAQAGEKVFPLLKGKPVKLLSTDNEVLFVQENSISVLEGATLHTLISDAGPINDVVVKGNELWIATQEGLKVVDRNSRQIKRTEFAHKRISALDKDVYDRIWVATALEGVYMQSGDSFTLKLNTNGANTLICTGDSAIWVGTSVGLYRLAAGNFAVTRYAEEGYSGYELPDNIVERLYQDEQSNIWVLMPENISFKSSTHYNGEIPSYTYVGDKYNDIYTIVALAQSSYFFVTGKGLFFLPSNALKEDHHQESQTEEIHSTTSTQAYALTSGQLYTPAALKDEPVLFAGKANENIYFLTAKGGWKVPEKKLLKGILKK
ncbi:hypothetical protein [Taibaiella koreensis]|uniref:hypothetical protein n=1 Tax=Taibaiella koreensis TaxID=1268548 RepID=UPI000E59C141|nr:hypothetical protein [Taibaiella koreensis]